MYASGRGYSSSDEVESMKDGVGIGEGAVVAKASFQACVFAYEEGASSSLKRIYAESAVVEDRRLLELGRLDNVGIVPRLFVVPGRRLKLMLDLSPYTYSSLSTVEVLDRDGLLRCE